MTNDWRRINPRAYPIARAHQAAGEVLYQELEWYADAAEPPRLLGLVLRDRVDNDYSWVGPEARTSSTGPWTWGRASRTRSARQRPPRGHGALDGGVRYGAGAPDTVRRPWGEFRFAHQLMCSIMTHASVPFARGNAGCA
jgi:hypothetical protein